MEVPNANERPLKIIHVIESTATGTLTMASMLANMQAKNGMDVVVVYSLRADLQLDVKKHFSNDVLLLNLQMSERMEKLLAFVKLRQIFKKIKPDAVILHSSFAGFIGRIAAIGAFRKTKFLYIPHCISFMRQDIGRIKQLCFVALERIASLRRATYVACSASEHDAVLQHLPKTACVTVENAVDASRFAFNRNDALPETRTIVSVGGIRAQKNPLLFAKICRTVLETRDDIRFVWIGDGDPALRTALTESGVFVTGWESAAGVKSRLQEANIYLSTSSWEGMPVSVIEAQLSGLSIVATRCAGNSDVVSHGKTGWLFNSVNEAQEWIENIISKDVERNAMVTLAHETACSRFGVNRYMKDMNKLLYE